MIYGVSFEKLGPIYPFECDLNLNLNDKVVCESDFGIEIGNVVKTFKEQIETKKSIMRIATEEDLSNDLQNGKDAMTALEIARKKVEEHSLLMKMLRARYTLDRTKLIYFFSADGRVDFRIFVKDLASTFKTRIELRQIGVRDTAKIVGGIGMCGMQTCCSRFERDFKSITLKYAKTQQLLINPSKISGVCGRLLCCLAYENDAYLEALKNIPDTGDMARYDGKVYTVSEVNIFSKTIKMRDSEYSELKLTFDEFINGKGEKICDLKPPEETDMPELGN